MEPGHVSFNRRLAGVLLERWAMRALKCPTRFPATQRFELLEILF
jgi:hypothetical protein